MTYEAFETVELGQAEALIEMKGPLDPEEIVEKFFCLTGRYIEFEGPDSNQPT